MIWKSNNGKNYQVWEMDTGHIQNCIIKITKLIAECNYYKLGVFQIHGHRGWDWIQSFKKELQLRGIMDS